MMGGEGDARVVPASSHAIPNASRVDRSRVDRVACGNMPLARWFGLRTPDVR